MRVNKSVKLGVLMSGALALLASGSALAAGIIINVNPGQPTKPLSYADEAGRVVELGFSWSDVQIATRAKRYIRANFAQELPFSVDHNVVHIQTDPDANQWITVPVSALGQ